MTITFITGANKGLGYETARRLIELGQSVVIGARDRERGQTAADALGARFVQIDVTCDESVAAAAADVELHEGSIDVLINNAGVHGPHGDPGGLTGADVLNSSERQSRGRGANHHGLPPAPTTVGRPGDHQRQQRDGISCCHARSVASRVRCGRPRLHVL
jgi:NAD(P)-dependent dehydrogenase (short-subunit alcohol dehydrogenase family)